MRITVVTPTTGKRDSLQRVIDNVATLLLPGDEHLIMYDAPDDAPPLEIRHSLFSHTHRKHVEGSVFGNGQRDYAATIAQGQCIVYMDDDDRPGPEAIALLHHLPANRDEVHFFRMQTPGGHIYASDQPFVGLMGGPQCVPPVRDDLPQWMSHNQYEADGYFLGACHFKYTPVYHNEIICFIRNI